MPYLPSILRPLFERAETALLRHGAKPRTIIFLAVFSVLDGFLPMLPAEVFVLALCILQPKKGKIIVLVFAVASAMSAFLLALALGTLTTSAETLSQQLLGAQGPQALALVRSWGPVSMVFFSIFPDTPRSSIALLALSGVAPVCIGGMVCIGKLMLYASLLALIHHLPARVGRWRGPGPFWQRWLQGRASRFVAYCRRIRWLARHPEQRFSISKGISR
jgi:membrane protein YqaA with SNARE-associated domain